MIVHVYRKNESDADGMHTFEVNRVTLRPWKINGKEGVCLILGTLPNVTVIEMSGIRWFWIEEN